MSLLVVLLVATTASLTSVGTGQQPGKPWWETRLPGPKDKLIVCYIPLPEESVKNFTNQMCRDYGGQVSPSGVWCVGGKYDKYRLDECGRPPMPPKRAGLSGSLTEEERLAQRERTQRAADRVSSYANSIRCPAC